MYSIAFDHTQLSRLKWQSIWRAGGTRTIRQPCRSTWARWLIRSQKLVESRAILP